MCQHLIYLVYVVYFSIYSRICFSFLKPQVGALYLGKYLSPFFSKLATDLLVFFLVILPWLSMK